jgi:hypothetical protein
MIRGNELASEIRVNHTYFIIGGTFKAATSSVFTYLSAHPSVCGSRIKETAFFIEGYTGDPESSFAKYREYFASTGSGSKVLMEASPGYLGGGREVAARIRMTLPGVKLLFLLRDPINRFYSYYNFHVGQLSPDFQGVSLEEYISRCMDYSGGKSPAAPKMHERHLRALEIGRYDEYLEEFLQEFPREQISVMFYENLTADVKGFMKRLCAYMEIDDAFYDSYSFPRVNVTFTSRVKFLHQIALSVNSKMEKHLRQRPALKRNIVGFYKALNKKKEGYAPIPTALRKKLENYYRHSNDNLSGLLPDSEVIPWKKYGD